MTTKYVFEAPALIRFTVSETDDARAVARAAEVMHENDYHDFLSYENIPFADGFLELEINCHGPVVLLEVNEEESE